MDQGILETIKRNYHRKLLSTVIEVIEEGQDMIEKLKRINVKDFAYWVARAVSYTHLDVYKRQRVIRALM